MTRTPIEDRLADQLQRLAAHASTTPSEQLPTVEPKPRRRVGVLVGTAAVGLLAVIGLVAAFAVVDWDDGSDTIRTPGATDAPTGGTPFVPAANAWTPLPVGPASDRVFPATVWTGTEYLVWGGEEGSTQVPVNRGAAFNPSTGRWRAIAPGPIGAQWDPAVTWTGAEMLVCCQLSGEGAPGAAAYDPSTDTWRRLPDPPVEVGDTGPTIGAWTGTSWIVTAGASYDPEQNEWRRIAPIPGPLRAPATAVWTGREMLVWESAITDGILPVGYRYDPSDDDWETLPLPPESIGRSSMAWTGTEMVVWGENRLDETRTAGARYDPRRRQWTALPPAPLGPTRRWNGTPGSEKIVWAGDRLVVWAGEYGTGGDSTSSSAVLTYSPSSDTWATLPSAPTPNGSHNARLTWTGDMVMAYTSPLLALDPRTASAPDASSVNGRAESLDGSLSMPILPGWERVEGRPYLDVNSPDPVQSVDVATISVDAAPDPSCDLPVDVLNRLGPEDGYISVRVATSPFADPRPRAESFVPTRPPENAYARCLANPDAIRFEPIGFTESGRSVQAYVALGRSADPQIRDDLVTMARQLIVNPPP